MLDIYSLKEGHFEIIDTDKTDERAFKVRIFKLIRFGLFLDIIAFVFAILFAIGTQSFWGWSVLILPILIAVVLGYGYRILRNQLNEKIAALILEFNAGLELERIAVRYWLQNKVNEFKEENVRYNQAIGYKAIWYDDGLIEIEMIVDENYPGTKIFETYNFFSLAELIVTLEEATPDLDRWVYRLEDDSVWPTDAKQELNDEIQAVRIPWQIREFFSSRLYS